MEGYYLILQPATLREVKRIATGVLTGTILMIVLWTVIDGFQWTILWGGTLGALAAILNFLYLGISVQKAAASESGRAKTIMRSSYTTRMLISVVVMILGFAVPIFHWAFVIAPLFMPRLTILIMQMIGAYKPSKINDAKED